MSLPVILIVSAAGCGPCDFTFGDYMPARNSIPKPLLGGQTWSTIFIYNLLTGSTDTQKSDVQRYRLYHIKTPELKGVNSGETENFYHYTLENGILMRYAYTRNKRDKNKTDLKTTTYPKTGDASSKDTIINKSYSEIVSALIPNDYKYTIANFPSFLFIDGEIWNSSLNGGIFYAYNMAFKQVKIHDKSGKTLWISDRSNEIRGIYQLETIKRIQNGEINLKYPVENAVKVVEEEKKEEPLKIINTCTLKGRFLPFTDR